MAAGSRNGTLVKPSPPSDFDVLRNELQYHRLIMQTAIEDLFRSLRETYREVSTRPAVSNAGNAVRVRAARRGTL